MVKSLDPAMKLHIMKRVDFQELVHNKLMKEFGKLAGVLHPQLVMRERHSHYWTLA